jgi:FkbM family methyltransferase
MKSTFWGKANDLSNRGLSWRLMRRMRAWVRWAGVTGTQWSDDPRVVRAWWQGWEAVHYLRLLRWRDEGFSPMVVYDIGAHMGLWSGMAQHLFQPRQVVLFEPQIQFHEMAMRRRPNTAANWRLMPYALGDRSAEVDLYRTRNQAASSLLRPIETNSTIDMPTASDGTQPVRVMTLDELAEKEMLPGPDLIKIDVQGFESQVLAGGEKTIRETQRAVIEVSLHTLYQNQKLIGDILPLVTRAGFAVDDITEAYSPWPDLRLWQVDIWLRRISREA